MQSNSADFHLGSHAVQCELYHQLRLRKVSVIPEYRLPAKSPKSRAGWFYADLAILDGSQTVVALVEAKEGHRHAIRSRQYQNYLLSGIPSFYATPQNLHHLAEILDQLSLHQKPHNQIENHPWRILPSTSKRSQHLAKQALTG